MAATRFLNDSIRSRTLRFFVVALGAWSVSTVTLVEPAAAVIKVFDTWKDGNDTDPVIVNPEPNPPTQLYSENGVDSDSDGDIESSWFQGGEGTLNPFDTGGGVFVQRGNILDATPSGGSSSWTTYFTPEGSEIKLVNDQDAIKVTWVFSLTNVNASNTSQGFRFALVDSPDGSRLTANGTPAANQYRGNAIFMNMGGTFDRSNPFQLTRRNVNSNTILNAAGDWTNLGTTGAADGAHGFDAATDYTLTWLITRNSTGGLVHDAKITGGTINGSGTAQVLFTDATPIDTNLEDLDPCPCGSYQFDTFAIRPSAIAQSAEVFDFKSFKVEFLTTGGPTNPGDFNVDGKVDAADYVFLRDNSHPDADFATWRQNFGNVYAASGGSLSLVAVPEPGAMLLVLCAIAGAICLRRR